MMHIMRRMLSDIIIRNATPPPWEDFYCPLFGFETQKFLHYIEARATILNHIAKERDRGHVKRQNRFRVHYNNSL